MAALFAAILAKNKFNKINSEDESTNES